MSLIELAESQKLPLHQMIKFLLEKRPVLWEKNKEKVKQIVLNTCKMGNGFVLRYYNVLYAIYKT